MNLRLRFSLLWMLMVACFGEARAQTVTNVRAAQRAGTKLVDVYYDLSGVSAPATVAVAISSDGGGSYTIPVTTLSGAVGSGVGAGLNKHIVWNAGTDWNGQFSQAVRFRITASVVPPAPTGFALIPGGSFTMGRTSGDTDGQAPPVSVHVSAFYMAKFEVTKALWDEVRAWGLANGYTDLAVGGGKAANHPVHSIDWYMAVKWCNACSEKNGLTPCYYTNDMQTSVYRTGILNVNNARVKWGANGCRLPTEAEWEKAARGGVDGRRFPWGGDIITHAQANYRGGNQAVFPYEGNNYNDSPYHPSYSNGAAPYTSPVGSFAANGHGLHDVSGNVGEWCWDWYLGNYYASGASDPHGPEIIVQPGSPRVNRGSAWALYASGARCCSRGNNTPSSTGMAHPYDLGFRIARNAVP